MKLTSFSQRHQKVFVIIRRREFEFHINWNEEFLLRKIMIFCIHKTIFRLYTIGGDVVTGFGRVDDSSAFVLVP